MRAAKAGSNAWLRIFPVNRRVWRHRCPTLLPRFRRSSEACALLLGGNLSQGKCEHQGNRPASSQLCYVAVLHGRLGHVVAWRGGGLCLKETRQDAKIVLVMASMSEQCMLRHSCLYAPGAGQSL